MIDVFFWRVMGFLVVVAAFFPEVGEDNPKAFALLCVALFAFAIADIIKAIKESHAD